MLPGIILNLSLCFFPHADCCCKARLSYFPTKNDRLSLSFIPKNAQVSDGLKLQMGRFGLPSENDALFAGQDEPEKEIKDPTIRQYDQFRSLINRIIECSDPTLLPRMVTDEIEMLLSMRGYEGTLLLKKIIEDAERKNDEKHIERISSALDYVVSFVEEFVEQATMMDNANKELLGKIIKLLAKNNNSGSERELEEQLNELLEQERENFTPGFLRHVEGQCVRISTAPKMTPESSKMLNTLQIIQARVVEELGRDLGEGALVLGQLIGYDDENERKAVLDAGLTVRGEGFAKELLSLTEEALEGFERVKVSVDPELVKIVKGIDSYVRSSLPKISRRNSFE
eukprot:CAMPEP_0184869790 /NCGR_PEP_ID=MMETSP0580-20130426/35275_1 /TAXON_ID=1118495 /ORGANISM="Dactyliosolen fragilissimus" /LENGTH=341 /DNA_ID=CAMNT_0027371501 /DNA_START=90 /DNA_END=1115 /DNA_ORIENTATION=-